MDTSAQIVLDKSRASGGLNETNLQTTDASPRKDGKEAIKVTTSEESRAEETNKIPNSKRGQGKAIIPNNAKSPRKPPSPSGQSGKSYHRSSSTPSTNGIREKTEHGMSLEQEQSTQSPVGSTSSDTKPLRSGSLPSSGFSFKSHERAQKRKEYNSRIEEKSRAKEAEKSVMQEKSKEDKEAEIKMFRKSLVFRANPLPSFYNEPPPKMELKKTPPTRAISPKFGRSNRSHCIADAQSRETHSPQLRTRRLSLPELPSETTSLTGAEESRERASHPKPNHTDSI